jgi:glycosyltransferase involved in cell wall biosynthesis
LYGSVYNQEYWEECRAVIGGLPPNFIVNFIGSLEKEKVSDTLKNYHFMFMPSQGENYGHSIVESFMAGRPVIISDKTPWKNLVSVGSAPTAKGVGWDLPLDKPEEFVKVVEYCAAMGQDEYNIISKNAFDYATDIINDPKVLEANKRLFE